MDFEDTDQDKDKTTADRFDPEGGSEPLSDVGQVSIDEKLRRFANEQWVRSLVEDIRDDGDGKDATNLSDSVGHFVQGAAATGAMTSDMYSTFKAQMYRAIERNEREEKQQVQINLAEDREEKKRKAEEDAEEEFEGSVDRVKAEEKREREREAWSKATHSYAGMDLTGEEWGELSEKLSSNSPLRKWLVDKLMAKGKTRAESEKTADEVALLAKMQSIPKDQWTDEMKALDAQLAANPERREELNELLRDSATNKMSGIDVKVDGQARAASQDRSTEAFDDQLDTGLSQADATKLAGLNAAIAEIQKPKQKVTAGSNEDRSFASAPNLGEHFDEATGATVPLDAEKAKPQQIAANDVKQPPPAVSPGGGFAS